MVMSYIKKVLNGDGIEYEMDGNKIIVDCGGNDSQFARIIGLINAIIYEWTYELEMPMNINIESAYGRIIIENVGA